MEEYNLLSLPLFSVPDYIYTTVLEGVAYRLRLYYNTRHECWSMDIYYANGEPIISGARVVYNYPMFIDHEMPFSGFFVFTSKGKSINETNNNPYYLSEYYNLYYGYLDTTAAGG